MQIQLKVDDINIGAISKLMEVLTVVIPRSNPNCTPKSQSHQLFPKELVI